MINASHTAGWHDTCKIDVAASDSGATMCSPLAKHTQLVHNWNTNQLLVGCMGTRLGSVLTQPNRRS